MPTIPPGEGDGEERTRKIHQINSWTEAGIAGKTLGLLITVGGLQGARPAGGSGGQLSQREKRSTHRS